LHAEVTGIGSVRAKRITDAWAEQKIVREIMVFLHSNGVGTARAVRIFKTYGADAVQVMTENPYRLARDILSDRRLHLSPLAPAPKEQVRSIGGRLPIGMRGRLRRNPQFAPLAFHKLNSHGRFAHRPSSSNHET
jgi:Helix-hairpin-helix containing domain